MIVCLTICFAVLVYTAFIQPAVIKARLADGRCPECGYDIANSDQRCPECGRPNGLPPLDPKAFRSVRDAERILGIRLRPDPGAELLAELRARGEIPPGRRAVEQD
jgi:predicted amidophosphoribosyltransferase